MNYSVLNRLSDTLRFGSLVSHASPSSDKCERQMWETMWETNVQGEQASQGDNIESIFQFKGNAGN